MTLVLSMAISVTSTVALAAEGDTQERETELNIQHTYSQNGFTFEKVSHASTGTEEKDGIVDYLGNHVIAAYEDGVSALGNGDSVQSYSYCAVPYGDWIYMGTMYGALSAYTQIKRAIESSGVDVPEGVSEAVIDAMYNGKLNKGQEDDGYYAGSIFFKFNIKTGETKILMSRPMYEEGKCEGVPIFRSAVAYKDKLYFVGLVSNGTALAEYNGNPLPPAYALNLEIMMQTGVPSIYEVDPKTDSVKKVYECVNVDGYRTLNGNMDGKSVFTSTRAIGTFQDYLIAGGIQIDPNGRDDGYAPGDACILATNDPGSGSFEVIATMKDLFDYPAIWRDGSSGGGGIYQVVEYNGSLYVAIVSGTYDTMDPETRQFRPFAVVRGDYDSTKGNIDDKDAWTWTPVIGDKADGAKYTFGIDPSRTSSSACTLQPYGDYLYIGEYNDVNGSLNGILSYKEFTTLATNLSQSINLYRMDKDENIEMVVGDPTDMFPQGGISGWDSGYASHMNQYTWMTTVYDNTMYLSTMDETSLTRPIADVASGEWMNMSKEEWDSQLNYLKVLIELMASGNNTDSISRDQANALVDVAADSAKSRYNKDGNEQLNLFDVAYPDVPLSLTQKQRGDMAGYLYQGTIHPGMLTNQATLTELYRINYGMETLSSLYDTHSIDSMKSFAGTYCTLYDYYRAMNLDLLPDSLKEAIKPLLNDETWGTMKDLLTCMNYMRDAEAGFDLYAINQQEDGSVNITPVTTNGFNDRYNHGLRIFAETDDYLAIGTANPFYGTQIWRMSAHPGKAINVDAQGFFGVYDKKPHSITVSVTEPENAEITYSLDGQQYQAENFEFVSPGTYTVYYKVTAPGYYPVEGSENVIIINPSNPSNPSNTGNSSVVITATAGQGGTITPSGKVSVKSGGTQAFTITADEGYRISSVKVDGIEVGAVKSYTFENVKKAHSIEAEFALCEEIDNPDSDKSDETGCLKDASCPVNQFTDTTSNAWYHDGVHYCVENSIMNGVGDQLFAPNGTTTRAMIVTMLARLDGVDTSAGNTWYEAGVNWAVDKGISDGTNMQNPITREQIITMLYRFSKMKNVDSSERADIQSYDDATSVSTWAMDAMQWACSTGVVNGDNNCLKPAKNATRAEVATLLMRFCENVLK